MAHLLARRSVAAIVALATTAFAQTRSDSDTPSESEDVVVLSPFTVNAEEDTGYVANNTLAGSRLNTALVDTAAAIDVLTMELIQDIGAVNMDEALEYATNSANDIAVNSNSDNAEIEFPAVGINIRGLPATRTRNYLPITYSPDTFDIDRLEENRGPNSILYGIGSPAGIINVNTKRANVGRSMRRGSFMAHSAGGFRGTIDVNQALGDRAAVRLNAVYSDMDDAIYYHAYRKTEGAQLAFTFNVTDKIRFFAEAEKVDQDEILSTRRTPYENISSWLYNSPSPGFIIQDTSNPTAGMAAGSSLADYGIRSAGTSNIYIVNDDVLASTGGTYYTNGTGGPIYEENYPELWNRRANPGGANNLRSNEFETYSAGLEVELTPHTFLQLNYGYNSLDTETMGFVLGNLYASVDNTLGHAGEAYVEGQYRYWHKTADYTSYRATLSHELDLDKWGNYRFALMFEMDDENSFNVQRRERYVDADGMGLLNSDPRNSRNNVVRRFYFDPLDPNGVDWAAVYATGPAVEGFINGQTLANGTTAYSAWRNQSGPGVIDNSYETALIGLQAGYFDNHLILGGGIRRDTMDQRTYDQRDASNQFIKNEYGERWYTTDSWVDNTYEGDTRTYGVVYHINDQFRVMYNHSDNFGLPHSSKRSYPDGGPADNTEGVGYDFGIGFRLLDNRISGRITRFHTEATNAANFGYNLTTYSQVLWDAAVANSAVTGVTQAQADANFIDGTGGTYDQTVEGYEAAVTLNLTKNWRLNARYSYTDGYQSNSYPDQRLWRDGDADGLFYGMESMQFFDRADWASLPMDPSESGGSTIGEFIQRFKDDLAEDMAVDGVALSKNEPHKANMFTRYSFTDGALKGLFLGGGVKYFGGRDLGVGYDTNGNPIQLKGNKAYTVDFLMGYRFGEIMGLRDVSVQLNVTNVLDNDDYIITGRNATTGEVRRVTYPSPRQAKLSMNFRF